MCKGCVAEHVATGRAPLVALGMGTCKALVLLSPPPHQMPLCSVQDRRSELGSVVRGFPNLLEPLGGGSGDGDVVGGCGRGGGGGWYWCSCGPTWGQAGDKGEGMASTRGACCSGETEARSCFPQGRPQGSAAQLKQIGGGEA